MPRYSRGITKLSTKDRVKRSRSYRVRGFKRWVDPYPNVHGTLPEKMVYLELGKRGIPFLFLNNIDVSIPEINVFKIYQADFIIPSLMIIIEVQGARWHSMPATIEADAFKHALYMQKGYTVLAWWDYEILDNIQNLFNNEPRFAGLAAANSGSTELAPVSRTKVDTSKGIRTLNTRRAQRLLYKKKAPTIRSRYKAKIR